jgi:hypothetical protein
MKLATLILLSAVSGLTAVQAFADSTTMPSSPSEARQTWQNLPPAAQDALKQQAMTQAQNQKAQWDQLTPEQQAAKKADARTMMSERRAQFQSSHSFGGRRHR